VHVNAIEAVGDPTRRRIVELLGSGERSAGELAGEFAVSRPAVSRHLRVLRESGLVQARADAQRQMYSLRRDGVDELVDWVDRLRAFWTNRLDGLDLELRRPASVRTATRETKESP
jgi:DNA-binding transcriptional ArsR family regulator